jgi:hypothetical protein
LCVNVGNRRARHGSADPDHRAEPESGAAMIFYSWTALSGAAEASVAMGITDDRGRAMRAGEESLGSGEAIVVIIEIVRPAMALRTLAPCYARTGVGWLGKRTEAGDISWDRFFRATRNTVISAITSHEPPRHPKSIISTTQTPVTGENWGLWEYSVHHVSIPNKPSSPRGVWSHRRGNRGPGCGAVAGWGLGSGCGAVAAGGLRSGDDWCGLPVTPGSSWDESP